MLLRSLAVLVAANIMNNRVAPRLAPLTSALATGALVAMARRSGLSWEEIGFTHGLRGAKAGAALAAVVAAGYTVGIAVPHTRALFHDERALSLSKAEVVEAALLQVPVGTVLLEEVGFRGALYGMLRREHGTVTATAVSSALFGLWHILPAIELARANPALGELTSGGATGAAIALASDGTSSVPVSGGADVVKVVVGGVLSTAAAGVLFCELRRRGGLLAPSLLHLATNSLGYLFARIAPAPPARR
ncbi:CPBP family intramembrane glutamic endopeptidase [Nonomuraea sp. NPDC059194]|uniref:CPBP family intramembrane glutamic endopeptidase n=1 Tax=Nonomuraea sp. NPDC059194 TaxID=3346764 RepID=UPI00367515AC